MGDHQPPSHEPHGSPELGQIEMLHKHFLMYVSKTLQSCYISTPALQVTRPQPADRRPSVGYHGPRVPSLPHPRAGFSRCLSVCSPTERRFSDGCQTSQFRLRPECVSDVVREAVHVGQCGSWAQEDNCFAFSPQFQSCRGLQWEGRGPGAAQLGEPAWSLQHPQSPGGRQTRPSAVPGAPSPAQVSRIRLPGAGQRLARQDVATGEPRARNDQAGTGG